MKTGCAPVCRPYPPPPLPPSLSHRSPHGKRGSKLPRSAKSKFWRFPGEILVILKTLFSSNVIYLTSSQINSRWLANLLPSLFIRFHFTSHFYLSYHKTQIHKYLINFRAFRPYEACTFANQWCVLIEVLFPSRTRKHYVLHCSLCKSAFDPDDGFPRKQNMQLCESRASVSIESTAEVDIFQCNHKQKFNHEKKASSARQKKRPFDYAEYGNKFYFNKNELYFPTK